MTWKTTEYLWQWQLKSSPAELWPYVADTERFNQAARLPAIDFTETPLETGGSRRIAQTSKLGISVQYEDHPFEWVRHQWFSNLRVFEQGPLASTYARLTLEPNEAGTLLSYYIEVTPANVLGLLAIPYQFGTEMRRNFERVFTQIDDALQSKIDQTFPLKVTELSRLAQVRLTQLTQALTDQGHNPRWVQNLTEHLTTEADMNLARMRPYPLAAAWDAPRRAILELFLSAAKVGLLNMRWDLLCPLCQGAKFTATSLDEVHQGVHCPTCNIDYEAHFSQNVELTFTPHPQIREVHDASYCIGGPMVTPHILIHQTLAPGERRTLASTELAPSGYRLRTQQPGVEQWLELPDPHRDQSNGMTIAVEAGGIRASLRGAEQNIVSPTDLESAGSDLILINHTPHRQRIFIEQSNWYTNAVTAAYVTSIQHFRDLFSDEVLRPGEEIGVQGMTILFSDLVGSTAMYNRQGDAPSYAVVREQFSFLTRIVREYEGAIVKTIGDAVMAAFSEPARGVAAALAIQKEVKVLNKTDAAELIIKLGLHYGPCIAVTLNGRLDYFGTTVNLAARLEGQSQGGDVVISERVRRDPAVGNLLAEHRVNLDRFETAIKGFDEHFVLYRLTLPRPTPRIEED